MKVHIFDDGVVINGTFPDQEVIDEIVKHCNQFPLIINDPPYQGIVNKEWDKVKCTDIEFCAWMINWTRELEKLQCPRGALYVWGGIGKPRDGKKPPIRPFYRYLVECELQTGYNLANHITWKKKRAYGIQHNYLFTREELAYFVLGNVKKPRKFTVPLLLTKRGYKGFNKKYAAKSDYLRRSNVWDDITEIFNGKTHINQKPEKLMEIPIEIHTEPGEYVLDTFAGSGTTAIAARNLGRKFVLVEQDPVEFEKIVARLSK